VEKVVNNHVENLEPVEIKIGHVDNRLQFMQNARIYAKEQ
jgi:hypothetical protein